jgi:hypothetical protein
MKYFIPVILRVNSLCALLVLYDNFSEINSGNTYDRTLMSGLEIMKR